MLRSDFDASLQEDAPPADSSTEIAALWWLVTGNWQKAHDLVDAAAGPDAAWVHALLHRMEGDQANADYWYARSGRDRQGATIKREIDILLDCFLS